MFQRTLTKQGLKFKLATKVVKGDLVDGGGVKLTLEPSKGGDQEHLEADIVLVSAGAKQGHRFNQVVDEAEGFGMVHMLIAVEPSERERVGGRHGTEFVRDAWCQCLQLLQRYLGPAVRCRMMPCMIMSFALYIR